MAAAAQALPRTIASLRRYLFGDHRSSTPRRVNIFRPRAERDQSTKLITVTKWRWARARALDNSPSCPVALVADDGRRRQTHQQARHRHRAVEEIREVHQHFATLPPPLRRHNTRPSVRRPH